MANLRRGRLVALNQKIPIQLRRLITSFSIQPYCRAKHPCLPLRDAAQYVTKLPKAEHDADEWQAAMQALLLVVEHDGPTMFARIGIMRAINRHVERVFDPSRKGALQLANARTVRTSMMSYMTIFRAL